MQALLRSVGWLTSRNDIVLAVLIVAIIFMMILPLPTALIDVLIGTNMTLSAVLLMVAMYLPSPLSFSSFPSVLLITTLFRLGISIATTRLILLQADAGNIIQTFGNFVVGGNLVVGLVVFLILTIVQFIVITKGAERVAEVAARFSLDAMPGKQMAIDADLRAGAVDMDEARVRRTLIEKESQLYGAMDGAMKFVKGDAIAGLIIVAVNLLGGIIIGTMQRGLTASESVQVYSILTIGDGLISQIPALFIAICAGIIVTRVQAGMEPSNVGKDIGSQVLAQPKALLIAAAIAIGLGLIPGMPTLTFFVLGAVVGTTGYVLFRGAVKQDADTDDDEILSTDSSDYSAQTGAGSGSGAAVVSSALMIVLAEGLREHVPATQLNQELLQVRRNKYLDLGVLFPEVQLRFSSRLADNSYQILLYEVPVGKGVLRPDSLFVRDTEQNLQVLQVPFDRDSDFLPLLNTLWVDKSLEETLVEAGIEFLQAHQIVGWHFTFILTKYAADFLGIQETRFLMTSMEEDFPDLVKETLRIMPVQKIAEILQRLVSEEISIRNLRSIMGALAEWGNKEKDTVLLAEYVRMALSRYISYKYASSQGLVAAYLLAPNVEDVIREAVRQTSAGSYLALNPEVSRGLLDNIKKAVGVLRPANKSVLITSMDIRRYVHKLIESDLYGLPVLSYQELTPEVNVQPLARIELPSE